MCGNYFDLGKEASSPSLSASYQRTAKELYTDGIARDLSTKATHDPAYPLDIASRPYLIGHLGAGSRFLQASPLPLQNGALGAGALPRRQDRVGQHCNSHAPFTRRSPLRPYQRRLRLRSGSPRAGLPGAGGTRVISGALRSPPPDRGLVDSAVRCHSAVNAERPLATRGSSCVKQRLIDDAQHWRSRLRRGPEPGGRIPLVRNDAAGWAELVERLRGLSISAIGLEASGGYERGAMRALLAAGMPARQVNPFIIA